MKKLVIGITAPGTVGLIRGQSKYFAKKGFRVYLLAPKTEQTLQYCKEENCILLPVPLRREIHLFYDFFSLLKILYHFALVRPHIVNLGTPKVSLLGMVAAKICGVGKRIYTCRGFRYESETGRLKAMLIFFEKLIFRCSHRVICISRSVESLGVEDGIFNKSKTVILGNGSSNGIDLVMFDRSQLDEKERLGLMEDFGIEDGDFVFGFVGRMVDRKGINELYEAFESLAIDFPNVKLVVVGPVEKEQIKNVSLIEKYNQHKKIIMTGKVQFNKIPLYMSLFDGFVLPAWWEGFGNVLIQAAALGVPVITNDVTGCKDAMKDGFNGLLIKKIKDPSILKATMVSLMENKDELRRLGKNGIEWAKGFDQVSIWQGLNLLYEQ